MDKTAWIVVSLCAVLIGVNMWLTPERSSHPGQPAPQVAQAPADPATQTHDEQNSPAAAAVAEASPVPTGVDLTPAAELTSHDAEGKPLATFRFSATGASLADIEMIGKPINSTKEDLLASVRLNSLARQGIGTLMFRLNEQTAPVFDTTVYHLVPEETNDQQVTFEGQLNDLKIRKVYSLKPLKDAEGNSIEGHAYCLHLSITVQNTGKLNRNAQQWGVYAGATAPISSREWQQYTYYIRYEDKSFHKENAGSFSSWFGGDKARIFDTNCDTIGWVGVMNQYYATLLRPVQGEPVSSYYAAPVAGLQVPGGDKPDVTGVEAAIGVPSFTLAAATDQQAGGSKTLEYDLFTGPKLNLMLSDLTKEFPKIDYIMDYGVFHVISYPMNYLINVFYRWFGNWGWAIVAMTFVVRLIIWPLYRKSYTSMKSMSLLQPKVQEIRQKYANNQQKASQEMIKLYREYNISPMGGCLPMFLQIPIFFSFFYVLQTAAEFRGAPFIGWVTDLSQMDTVATLPLLGWNIPINVLPIIMAITMILQMRMTPQVGGDPMQQRIIRLMPLFFFAFCYTYPSALALYWTTTNLISIVQTWIVRRLPQPELKKADPADRKRKKGFFERMAELQQEELKRRAQQQQR